VTSRARGASLLLIVAAAAAIAWWWTDRPDTTPYRIPETALSKWTLVTSDGTDPWIVGVRPPDALAASLFHEVTRRSRAHLVAPPHPAMPLVLRSEFEEGLQGVYGTDTVLRLAHETGVDSATFAPVCLAHQTKSGSSGTAEVYFVPFESDAFNQVRAGLVPAQPEQAGIGIYDPATVSPVLIVAATDDQFERWWPMQFDRERDCEAPLTSPSQH
jgi:hypothetical protein